MVEPFSILYRATALICHRQGKLQSFVHPAVSLVRALWRLGDFEMGSIGRAPLDL